MKSLVALVKNIYAQTNRKNGTYASRNSGHRRFIMESLETRVLLSADPSEGALVDLLEPRPEEPPALISTDFETSISDTAEEHDQVDTFNGIEPEHEGEEDGGEFIEHEAYDELYGEFDYGKFLDLEQDGPLGGPGGTVVEDAYPTDALVNNNGGASGTVGFTQSETSVIAFGSTVLVAYNDSGSTTGGTNKFTGFARSTDGGVTFTDGGTLPTNTGGDAGDPVLAKNDTTGRIYFATLGASVSTIQVFRSDDGGQTWALPVNGTPGGSGEDKEWITVDNFSGSGNGNVYLVSRRFGGTSPGIYFFRSTDNGSTFGPDGGSLIVAGNQGAYVVVGPDHSVYAFWFAGTSIQMRKSTDQGLTFGAPVTVATGLVGAIGATNGDLGLTGVRQGTAVSSTFRSNEFPHAAVNPANGNIYVTYNNDGPGLDRADVYVVQSTNGGTTWSAPVKVNDDVTTTDQWQPTLAVTPTGDKLGIFYSSRQEDPTTNNLFKYYGRIANVDPVTGALTFTPSFAISDTASLPEFGRDAVVNPVYMGDYNTAYATPGFFHVVWSDNRDDLVGGAGRKDPNVYYKAIDLGLTVRSTTPANGSIVSTIPTAYTVNFSDPINTATVNPGDFAVDGGVATSFLVNSPTQVTFSFGAAPFSTQGLHTMTMAANAINRLSDGDGVAAFSGTFRYDALQLQVTTTVPPTGSGVFTLPGPFTYDVNFNEPLNPASVQTWDLVLGPLTGPTVTAVTVLPGNTTARFTLSGITVEGTLTANIMAGAISDQFGNPNSAFSGIYQVDLVTAPYPTPLAAEDPLGSLIYDPTQSGTVNFAGDVDNFTLNIDAGQTISLTVATTSTLLVPRIELFDPSNVSLGFATASVPGGVAGLETKSTTVGGVYTFAVSGVGTTTGAYSLQAILNSAFELEGKVLGNSNDAPSNAAEATINATDSGWIQNNGLHTATNNNYIVGQSPTFPPGGVNVFRDYFTFALPAGTPLITAAELRLFNPVAGYNSPDATETYSLFDVSASAAALDTTRLAGDTTGISIFGDLGTGTSYGTRVVSAADNNTTVAIPLNADALAALNAAIGSTISLGGAITTIAGTATQTMFGGTTGAAGTVQLVLQGISPTQNIDSSFVTLSTPQGSAQRGALLGQTDLSYTATAVAPTFEDISTTGTVITALTNQDNNFASIAIGFAFPFYGVSNTGAFVTSNGIITFGGINTAGVNADLTTQPSFATIAPFWDDLHTGGGVASSNVFFQVLGSGVNQHLTIQWNNVRFLTGGTTGDNITFEAQLYADGRIQFNYLDLTSGTAAGNNGASASVGVKAAGLQGPNRTLLAFNNGPNAFVGTGKSTLLTLGDSTPDYYAFTLNANDTVTLAATAETAGNLTLELRNSVDAILATGISGSGNLERVISNFTVSTAGTYYARIKGDGATGLPYSLLITRNAAFDTESNDTALTAQPLDGTRGALGALFASQTVNAIDSGWIATDGTHITPNNNYAVGQVPFNGNPVSQFRNYFSFALSAGTPTIVGAELRLFQPTGSYASADPSETFTLFDVLATATALDVNRVAGDLVGQSLWADLGLGATYGSREVSAADNNTTVVIPLNAAAVAALNAAIGSTISIGGAITSILGTGQQADFGFTSGAPGTVQLLLQTLPDDWYSVTIPTTAHAMRLETSTPGDGPGQPVNTLNPNIEVYDSTGTTLIASGTPMPDGRNEFLWATGLTPGGTYKVRVTSQVGTTGEYFFTRAFNFLPVMTSLTVGSPINENDTATVNGTFTDADALDTHTVLINWGSGEGSTTLTLAAGVLSFSASHQYKDDNPTGTLFDVYAIGVTVTDNLLGSDTESVNLTVNNVAPVVAAVSGPSAGVRGQTLDFSSSFTDVGTLDTHEVKWDFGDGNVIDFHSTTGPGVTVSHIFTANGVYTVTLSIRDDDGAETSMTKAVTITTLAIQTDPCDADRTALVVGGTTDNDSITFSPQGSTGDIAVYINDLLQGVFHPTGRIILYGQAGDDDIQVAGGIALDAWLYGDAGNDHLKGGAGNCILLGGDGDDVLIGGSGRSILIGGRGQDRLIGGSGDDILIGGFTNYDQNVVGLCAITDLWKSNADTYEVRVTKLRLLLNGITVIDDEQVDMLTGSSGVDWFFSGVGDVVTKVQSGETDE